MHKIWYIRSPSREMLAMKILTHLKDAGKTTMQKAAHKTKFFPASLCRVAALQQQFN